MIDDVFIENEDFLSNLWNKAVEVGLVNRRWDQSNIGLLFSVFTEELNSFVSIVQQYSNQFSITTVTDESLLESMSKVFVNRGYANNSKVMLKITKLANFNESVVLYGGFKVTTVANNGPVYELAEDVYLWKGVKSVLVLAFAVEPGAESSVSENELVEFENENDIVEQISITNPHPSWGGTNDESLESVRNRALSWRYTRDGTEISTQNQLDELNVLYSNRKIVEYFSGNGSVLISIDIDNPYHFEDIKDALELKKVSGPSMQIIKAKRIYVNLAISVEIEGEIPLTSNEQAGFYNAVDFEIREYFGTELGVGSAFSINQLKTSLYRYLSSTYDVLNIDVKVQNEDLYIDNGKVKIQPTEVIFPNKLTIFINYEKS